jgi:predicted GNAT family N-acyltransferase
MAGSTIVVRRVTWRDGEATIRAIRETVFVREQGVPVELEMDGADPECIHVVAYVAAATSDGLDRAVGTARLVGDGKIGRMAVLKEWRGRGVGSALVAALLGIAAESGRTEVRLAAQTHAVGFYERQGFRVTGQLFFEAGIPHRMMQRQCKSRP